ncbi:carbohydrate binding family 9 domain-containing protein [Candidatus Poribacteria bacterium]|nr:carbohydrate binding family 9 domain-containing protein [Candidatus Poribacteria bacterium]
MVYTISSFFRSLKIGLPLFIFLMSIYVSNVSSETHNFQIKAYRTYESIEIDGELNELDWRKAEIIDKFIQIEPYEGEPNSEPMEVRILYDTEYLYFGFICHDSEIDKLVANEMRRDSRGLHDNDNVFVLLDTYNDKRSGFFFRVNPLGAIQDRAITNNGDTLNGDWDAVVECKSKINESSWTSELKIPFSQLRFKKTEPIIWGINVGRELMRTQEETVWTPVPVSYGGLAKYRTTNLGTLVGLEGISPSRNLEFLPYALPGITQINEVDSPQENTREFKVGFDAKYGITSNLTADLTYNTDFAQVEADEEQVNLTRFNLFFPEKRPFFLEGAGLFDFGIPRQSFRRPPPMLLFYSRQIGIDEGRPIPIILGGKASGKIGTYGVGFLNVLTDEYYEERDDDDGPIDIKRTNYSVFRVTKDAIAGSRIGLIAVNKDAPGSYNRAGGVDFEFRPTDRLDIRAMWSSTYSPDISGNNNAWYFGSQWRNDDFRVSATLTDIDDDFNPEVGFVRQKGIKHLRSEARWVPRPQKYGIREIWSGPEVNYILTQDYEIERWSVSYSHWTSFSSADSILFFANRKFEKLKEEFEIRDGIIIPIEDYQYDTLGGRLSSSDTRPISATTGFEIGSFYNGNLNKYFVNGTIKPNYRISIDGEYQYNHVTLPAGEFHANLFSGRLSYSFSTKLYAKLFTQWNTETNLVTTNFLINYIYRPGSDFYFVFNQIYDTDGTQRGIRNLTVVAKMTFWWNP